MLFCCAALMAVPSATVGFQQHPLCNPKPSSNLDAPDDWPRDCSTAPTQINTDCIIRQYLGGMYESSRSCCHAQHGPLPLWSARPCGQCSAQVLQAALR